MERSRLEVQAKLTNDLLCTKSRTHTGASTSFSGWITFRAGTEDINPQRGGGKGIPSRGNGQYRMWEVTRMSKGSPH